MCSDTAVANNVSESDIGDVRKTMTASTAVVGLSKRKLHVNGKLQTNISFLENATRGIILFEKPK